MLLLLGAAVDKAFVVVMVVDTTLLLLLWRTPRFPANNLRYWGESAGYVLPLFGFAVFAVASGRASVVNAPGPVWWPVGFVVGLVLAR